MKDKYWICPKCGVVYGLLGYFLAKLRIVPKHECKKILGRNEKLLKGMVLVEEAGFRAKELYVSKELLKKMEQDCANLEGYLKNVFKMSIEESLAWSMPEWASFIPRKEFSKKWKRRTNAKGKIYGIEIKLLRKKNG